MGLRFLQIPVLILTWLIAVGITMSFWPEGSSAQTAAPVQVSAGEPVFLGEEEWNFEEALERARQTEAVQFPRADVLGGDAVLEAELQAAVLRLQPRYERNHRGAQRVASVVFTAARTHGIDPLLALAMASRESSLNPNVRLGSGGEMGLFQVMPRSHALQVCGRGRDMGQPRANADTALCYYAHLKTVCETDDNWVLVGAYGTGKCYSPGDARGLTCSRRKRAELVRAVGVEKALDIWPI